MGPAPGGWSEQVPSRFSTGLLLFFAEGEALSKAIIEAGYGAIATDDGATSETEGRAAEGLIEAGSIATAAEAAAACADTGATVAVWFGTPYAGVTIEGAAADATPSMSIP
jgi:hypothetical protein